MLKQLKRRTYFLWIAVLLVCPLPLAASLGDSFSGISSRSIALYCGIFAYTWMLAGICLATKPTWIERRIGLPEMYLIHGGIGFFSLLAMSFHVFKLSSDGLTKVSGTFAFYLFTVLFAYSVLFFGGRMVMRVQVLRKFRQRAQMYLKHEISMWIHRLNFLVVLAVTIHVTTIDYIIRKNNGIFILIFYLYTGFALLSYISYVISRKKKVVKAKVKRISMIDEEVTELILEGGPSFRRYRAGDFVFVSFPEYKELREPHPFSIGNLPESGTLVLTISGVGDFTRKVSELRQGAQAVISQGYGILHDIVETLEEKDRLVFITGGVGVVPLLSLVQEFVDRDTLFLYTVQKDREFIGKDIFEEMEERENFRCLLQKGRFSEEKLEREVPLGEEFVYILAGTSDMNLSYARYLKKKGISSDRIYFEEFYF
ncbi:MAG: hypothetical protein Q3993_06655 [Filifactor alocis]|nr:hypothetical protein [Filifactor alocis]